MKNNDKTFSETSAECACMRGNFSGHQILWPSSPPDYKHDLARNIREDNSRHFKMKALTSEILVQQAFREQQINEGLFVWLWD